MKGLRTSIPVLALAVAAGIAGFAFWRYARVAPGTPTPPGRPEGRAEGVSDDRDVIYARETWSGLCRNAQGEEGSCTFRLRLSRSGDLVGESSWTDGTKQVTNPAVRKALDAVAMEMVVGRIRDAGVLTKPCDGGSVVDYRVAYRIDLDGVRKEFLFPGCEAEMRAVDALIDGYLETDR